jgi:hypothetical protein
VVRRIEPAGRCAGGAAAVVLAFAYSLFAYAKAQTRIRTASGIWLDIVAQDFFGTRIVRAAGQNDDSFRSIILANLLRPQATRQAISDVIEALTGFAPRSSNRSAQWTAAPMASAMAAMGALGPMDRSPFPPKHFWLRIAHGSRASQRLLAMAPARLAMALAVRPNTPRWTCWARE